MNSALSLVSVPYVARWITKNLDPVNILRMSETGLLALRLGVALGIGLLIGAERERRKGKGPQRSAAGIRTFTITALLGAVCFQLGGTVLLAVVILALAGLTGLSYLRTQKEDPGLTTESALLLTLILGALAMREPAVASVVAVVIAILLAARTGLHRFVRTVLTEQELHDALILAGAVIVVLPLIPDRYIGPFGAFNPRTVWKIVVLMMAVSALGYIAVRAMGSRFGLPVAGFTSGFASSAATIAAMGARVREQPEVTWPATAGAVLSSIATIAELWVVLLITNQSALSRIRIPLICAGAAAALYGAIFTLRTLKRQSPDSPPPGSAFSLKVTVILAATLTAAVFASAAANAVLGRRGLIATSALAGFGDAHSAAVSIASLVTAGKITANDAAIPIFAALTTNTVTKAVLSFTAGGRSFALRVVPGLILMIVPLWVAAFVGR
jgi:uncharacterized membrane protein (DUF4010 family)